MGPAHTLVISNPRTADSVGTVSILQVRKLRLGELMRVAWSHTTRPRQSTQELAPEGEASVMPSPGRGSFMESLDTHAERDLMCAEH